MRRSSILIAGLVLACSSAVPPSSATSDALPSSSFEHAGPPSARLADVDVDGIASMIDSHFSVHGTDRMHIQLDRPLYRPGEVVWIKTWAVRSAGFEPAPYPFVGYQLLDPRGLVAQSKQVQQQMGSATNDFVLPDDAAGGKWTVRATLPSGEIDERPFIVASYSAPRIDKELEFVREAYGPGDTVEALVELRAGTGAPLADHRVRVLLQVDGETVSEATLRTDAEGAVIAGGTLPQHLTSGDGLLTVLVEEGGITESISRSVPIVLADARLAFFPEGGDLVAGLPGRVYLQSTNRHGEPADVEGVVVDDRGETVATFRTLHDGLGRFAFTPEVGRSYEARITVPSGIDEGYGVPAARDEGCVLHHYDDPSSREPSVRLGIRCTGDRRVVVTGVLRERAFDQAAVAVKARRESRVYLTPDPRRRLEAGAVRVTLFDEERHPLAERLVYRNHGRTLQIGLTTDQETYGPRDEVIVDVTTADPEGTAVPAEIALAVVDDGVLTFADDENGHMLTRLYLEPELVDRPEDPAWYFDPDESLAPVAMDMLMGTMGYRRFDWRPIFEAPEPVAVSSESSLGFVGSGAMAGAAVDEVELQSRSRRELRAQLVPEAARPAPSVSGVEQDKALPALPAVVAKPDAEPALDIGFAEDRAFAHDLDEMNEEMADDIGQEKHQRLVFAPGARKDRIARGRFAGFAPVRVFPAPDYRAGFQGTRTDFRDTVHWAPTVKTGAKGTAQVRFYLSDAITAFRITAEGLGGGHAGHAEATINSVLPVSLATRLPPAVSVGDRIELPLTTTSTRSAPLDVTIETALQSEALTIASGARHSLSLPARGSKTHFVPIDVGSGSETATLRLTASGGGLSDNVVRELQVVPPGFPQAWSVAGDDATTLQRFELELTDVVDHSLAAVATWHPSPVSSLLSGMEGLIRTPGGCFEQTSSTNWPNVAILRYLEAHDGDPRLRAKSGKALDAGYGKLTGYQVAAGGFETWGSGPGKEVLSAFGLLQFADMSQVYDVAPAVLQRDVDYLLAQRDGQGGFRRTGESAHGYGSAPKSVLDGFITYALVETGHDESLGEELDHQAEVAVTSDDPYVLALATRTLLKAGRSEGSAALKRLAGMQVEDGSFPGAESSITRSYEANLLVESTALAALAMMQGGERLGADRAVDWIIEHRQGQGTWGATQATALALGALTEHAERSAVPATDGQVEIRVNGERMERRSYLADATEPLELVHWANALKTGINVIEIVQPEGSALPWNLEVSWTSVTPATAPGCRVGARRRSWPQPTRPGAR